jgi:phosphopantothenoylcysteine decarboxylase/phosphopantothenate--cysteine ligase
MTEAGTRFVTPLTFEALTHQSCVWDMWSRPQAEIGHVAWSEWAEAVVVAPATANFLAKCAQGLADDFASCLMLAHEGPKLMAPAMNTGMWLNPATQANVRLLMERGLEVMVPPCGRLASGRIGPGRLPHPKAILRRTAWLLGPKPLKDKVVVVTAGATWESWDDIRYLSNRSSGQMGLALAQAAWLMGARVILIAGPSLEEPRWSGEGFDLIRVETTQRMLEAVLKSFPSVDVLVMSAAPADFRPRRVAGKIKKDQLDQTSLVLEQTPDILKTLSQRGQAPHQLVVGFAAESEELLPRARAKLVDKGLDFIVANQAGGPRSAFGAPDTQVWLLSRDGEELEIGPGPKFGVAWALWEKLVEKINS